MLFEMSLKIGYFSGLHGSSSLILSWLRVCLMCVIFTAFECPLEGIENVSVATIIITLRVNVFNSFQVIFLSV